MIELEAYVNVMTVYKKYGVKIDQETPELQSKTENHVFLWLTVYIVVLTSVSVCVLVPLMR